jgi:hypothetical protein
MLLVYDKEVVTTISIEKYNALCERGCSKTAEKDE